MPSNQSCGLNNCIITPAQFIHQPQSDKGIFWSIMLESRSHMSPNVCPTKTVLFSNGKYLLYNGEYMKHCPLCRSLLGQGLCFTGYKCLPIILILDQTTQPAHSWPRLFVYRVVSDMGWVPNQRCRVQAPCTSRRPIVHSPFNVSFHVTPLSTSSSG